MKKAKAPRKMYNKLKLEKDWYLGDFNGKLRYRYREKRTCRFRKRSEEETLMDTVFSAKVFMETRWFVKCPRCRHENDVPLCKSGQVTCVCGLSIAFDNNDPEMAEEV